MLNYDVICSVDRAFGKLEKVSLVNLELRFFSGKIVKVLVSRSPFTSWFSGEFPKVLIF